MIFLKEALCNLITKPLQRTGVYAILRASRVSASFFLLRCRKISLRSMHLGAGILKDSYTVVVMSSSGGPVRQHSVSRTMLITFCSIGLLILFMLGASIYLTISAASKLTSSKQEKKSQILTIEKLNNKILDQKMQIKFHETKWDEVRGMVKTVKHVLGLENTGVLGQGGSSIIENGQTNQNPFNPTPNTLDPNSQNVTLNSNPPPPISETPEIIPKLKGEVKKVYDAVLGSLSELEQMPFVLPLRLSSSTRKSYWYSSGFGYRIHPITKSRHFHSGLDVATRLGTPVISAAHGVVTKVQRSRSGLGNTIRIQHPVTKMETIYGHLQKFANGIRRGKKVARGEVIGYVGSSGSSTGTHLHYGVYVNGKAVNPRNYIIEKIYY